jgi:uncharacterized glyoxalase superfamily protein PhnB
MTVALEAGLVGRDESALCGFYTRVLGFALEARLEFPVGTVCKLRRGAARLKIFFPRDAIDPSAASEPWYRPGGWRYAALLVERLADVDALASAAAAAHGRVLMAPTDHRAHARMAMVADPEGNVWELLADVSAGEDERA